jgi:hypothetical protein
LAAESRVPHARPAAPTFLMGRAMGAHCKMDPVITRVSLAQAEKALDFAGLGVEGFGDTDWLLTLLQRGDIRAMGLCMVWDGDSNRITGMAEISAQVWGRYNDQQFAEAIKRESVPSYPNGLIEGIVFETYFFPTISIFDAARCLTGFDARTNIQPVSVGLFSPRRGGRPPVYHWDEIWIATCLMIHEEGMPNNITRLVERMQDACRKRGIPEPDEKTLRPKAAALFYAFRDDRD